MQKFSIREIREKDSTLLLDIKKRSIPQCASTYNDKDIKSWLDYCNAQDPNTCFSGSRGYIAYDNEEPIGFVEFSDKDSLGHIDNMFILPTHTKKGIGTELFKLAENDLKNQGIENFSIRSTLNAQEFYAGFGYALKEPGIARAGLEIVIMEK